MQQRPRAPRVEQKEELCEKVGAVNDGVGNAVPAVWTYANMHMCTYIN